jgi:hypothetical protein
MPVRETAPPMELARMPQGILVGTPMYGGQCFERYLLGVFDLQQECARRGIPLSLHTVRNESLIPRGRNRVLHDFLASDASHLIFIDADIGFTGRDVLRLVAHSQANPGTLLGGTYAKKNRDRYDPAFVPLQTGTVVTDAELVEIMCLAGGFMLISRDVAMKMAGAYHDMWYRDGATGDVHILDLFGCYTDPETRQYWSEDYAWCMRWRQIGGRVLLDPNILLTHNGTTTFEGDPTSVFINPPPAPPRAARKPRK